MLPRLLATLSLLAAAPAAWAAQAAVPPALQLPESFRASTAGLEYIDTSFENASPLWYQYAPDQSIELHLLYDHERDSPNRASGHVHFLIHAKAGAQLTFEFKNLENYWNGKPSLYGRHFRSVLVSEDGRDWRGMSLENLPDGRVRLHVEMPGPRLYVARLEPYRVSDLDRFLASIRPHRLVQITPIGRTVLGRELEIVRLGDAKAPFRVFLRARAHPWEPAGNWVFQGLARRLLSGDAAAKKFLGRYCVYFLPMANKDGVALGRTRFNAQGRDLNRNWDKPAVVHEFASNWISGVNDFPSGQHWENYGANLATVLYEYFGTLQP